MLYQILARSISWVPILIAISIGSINAFAVAQPGDLESGAGIYAKRCTGCHGVDGDGFGPAWERLLPPPRDFTLGMYKITTLQHDEFVPPDEDLVRIINEGMPGTSMPGWTDVLSDQEIVDLVTYVKSFSGYDEEKSGPSIEYGKQVPSSPDSIARGRKLFMEQDRCSECHGQEGKGDSVKRLLGDNHERTWPRNLTKPWTFTGGHAARDIFTRISSGIPGTQMKSYADESSSKVLSVEDRWHLANYVYSLAKTVEIVDPKNIVIKALRVDDSLPSSVDDPRWSQTAPSTFFLVPQIIARERQFTPSNDTITVRAIFSEEELSILLEWDDRTQSIPGNEQAIKISQPGLSEDGVAIQLPVTIPEGMQKPYFGMGDAKNPVNIWFWKSGTVSAPESISLMNTKGFKDIVHRTDHNIIANGSFSAGTWRVLFNRSIRTDNSGEDLQFVEGAFIPISFAAWDGSAEETGSKHTMTTWYWIILEPQTTYWPLLIAAIMMMFVGVLEYWWLKSKGPGAD